jgi:hypothetical protein
MHNMHAYLYKPMTLTQQCRSIIFIILLGNATWSHQISYVATYENIFKKPQNLSKCLTLLEKASHQVFKKN